MVNNYKSKIKNFALTGLALTVIGCVTPRYVTQDYRYVTQQEWANLSECQKYGDDFNRADKKPSIYPKELERKVNPYCPYELDGICKEGPDGPGDGGSGCDSGGEGGNGPGPGPSGPSGGLGDGGLGGTGAGSGGMGGGSGSGAGGQGGAAGK